MTRQRLTRTAAGLVLAAVSAVALAVLPAVSAQAAVADVIRLQPDFSTAEYMRKSVLLEREEDRELLRSRYLLRETMVDMARRVSLSRVALYKRLNRLHQRLFDCVSKTLQESNNS